MVFGTLLALLTHQHVYKCSRLDPFATQIPPKPTCFPPLLDFHNPISSISLDALLVIVQQTTASAYDEDDR